MIEASMNMNQEPIRVGLIGVGGVCAGVHYPGLRLIPGVDIAGICDADEELLAQRGEEWNVRPRYDSVERFLRDIKPDAVVVATPNCAHKSIVLASLEAGCHVLCEKPLGMDTGETEEMLQAAERLNRRHMTAFTYRFVPGMRYLASLVRDGSLGEIRHVRIQRLQDWPDHSLGWRQYRAMAGSGQLADMGVHRIDLAHDLLGPITSVSSSMRNLLPRDRTRDGQPCRPQDVDDWVAWLAEFESGATGVFESGRLSKGRGPAGEHDLCELNGSDASAVYQLHTPHQILFAARGEPYELRDVPEAFLKLEGSPRDPTEGDPQMTFRYDQAWEFISAIRENRACRPSFHCGVRAQAVCDAIIESAELRRWVDVT